MDAFPAFFPLAGRTVVIVGVGEAAEAKARLFEGSPARIARVEGDPALSAATYKDAVLVFVADPDPVFAEKCAQAARSAGVPVNVVDRPMLCDFTTPAVIDRGEVVVAIGTGGAAPMLATMLRQDIEARTPEGLGLIARLFRDHQDAIRAALPETPRRRAFLLSLLTGPVAQAAQAGDMAQAARLMEVALKTASANGPIDGQITVLVAAGPADLISLRALRALSTADILIVETGCDADIIGFARRDARRCSPTEALADVLRLAMQDGLNIVWATPLTTLDPVVQAFVNEGASVEVLSPAPNARRADSKS